ncbi:hypothetical protein [Sodalis sp.]|uniref:hypothetical protein n=1 Tax=Sodalis sp. (in: enterobacteria) TaxID=1898979 RepID=UPI003873C53F
MAPEITLSDVNVSECAKSINKLTEYQLVVIETAVLDYNSLKYFQKMKEMWNLPAPKIASMTILLHLAELKND